MPLTAEPRAFEGMNLTDRDKVAEGIKAFKEAKSLDPSSLEEKRRIVEFIGQHPAELAELIAVNHEYYGWVTQITIQLEVGTFPHKEEVTGVLRGVLPYLMEGIQEKDSLTDANASKIGDVSRLLGTLVEIGDEQTSKKALSQLDFYMANFYRDAPLQILETPGLLKGLFPYFERYIAIGGEDYIGAFIRPILKADRSSTDDGYSQGFRNAFYPAYLNSPRIHPNFLLYIMDAQKEILAESGVKYVGPMQKTWLSCNNRSDDETIFSGKINTPKELKRSVDKFTEEYYKIWDLEKAQPGIVNFLHDRFGITNFSRYSDALLLHQYEQAQLPQEQQEPHIVWIGSSTDYNGGFARPAPNDLFDQAIQLPQPHSVRVFEPKSKLDLNNILLSELLLETGLSSDDVHDKLRMVCIACHGSNTSFALSDGNLGTYDITDASNLVHYIQTNRGFSPQSIVEPWLFPGYPIEGTAFAFTHDIPLMFLACDVGKRAGITQAGIAQVFSRLGLTVFSKDEETTSNIKITLSLNNNKDVVPDITYEGNNIIRRYSADGEFPVGHPLSLAEPLEPTL